LNDGGQHPLDNVVWTALTTVHAGVALGVGLARHYPRDMAPFSAVAEPSAAAYADLAAGLAPGVEARLFRPPGEAAPPGWETLSARPIMQMVAGEPSRGRAPAGAPICPLGVDDAADMLALAEAAKPGPLGPRSVLLGSYVGVRDPAAGRLLAMGGERFHLPGHVELSAICVHPDARGLGLGRMLTRHLVHEALGRGEVPFLHVFPNNPAAALYARLGFYERARPWVIWRRPLPAARGAGP
jgi:ribosomal protein S18 acetylase RimI-like enzyme